jgi:arylformamidase
MKIFDISRPLFNGLAPWPGDTAFQYELKWKMAEGATVNVGAVTMGVHNGSHADAPFHFEGGADSIDRMPLETYLGDAVVVDLTEKFETDRTRQITIGDLESSQEAPRLLLKTGVWKDSRVFPEWIR